MKLTVLVDNNTYIDRYYYGEPAVSFYIEDGEEKLLFDVGYSDVFIKNAELLGIDLAEVTSIVLSHGHDDHTRGLSFFLEQFNASDMRLLAHPDALKEKQLDGLAIGSPLSEAELAGKIQLQLLRTPYKITERLFFLGEIPETNLFEKRTGLGTQKGDGGELPDLLFDDTALAYKTENGLFIITGCSHSGICNIIEYAKMVCNETRILGVLGGFHLFDASPRLTETIRYFEQNKINNLYPCHCVNFAAKAEIHKKIPLTEVGVGLELNF